MKRLVLLALSVAVLSCGRNEQNGGKGKLLALNEKPDPKAKPIKAEFYGSWTGTIPEDALAALAGKPVTITITKISADGQIMGNCAIGNESRSFFTEGTKDNPNGPKSFVFRLRDRNTYSRFTLDLNEKMSASIKPGNKKDTTPERMFPLERKPFVYLPEASTDSSQFVNFNKPKIEITEKGEKYESNRFPVSTEASYGLNASARKLTENDLKNLKKGDLSLLRNAVYARHGYIFQNHELARFFTEFAWYSPRFTNVDKELTAVEKHNLKLIKRFEKYAEEFYEQFGR